MSPDRTVVRVNSLLSLSLSLAQVAAQLRRADSANHSGLQPHPLFGGSNGTALQRRSRPLNIQCCTGSCHSCNPWHSQESKYQMDNTRTHEVLRSNRCTSAAKAPQCNGLKEAGSQGYRRPIVGNFEVKDNRVVLTYWFQGNQCLNLIPRGGAARLVNDSAIWPCEYARGQRKHDEFPLSHLVLSRHFSSVAVVAGCQRVVVASR